MARDDDPDKIAQAYSVFVRLVLPPYTIHFKSPFYIQPSTLDLLDKKVCKETVKATAQNVAVRQKIGADSKFWAELQLLLKAAIPSLERRCFSIWDPAGVDYESTSGSLIASNYPALWRDLERINDLISITRNILTIGAVAQELAAEHIIDHEVFRLINCCVRVTARGYDGDAGTGEEEKWQWIVNAYKKLLNTCLMFVNNLVAQNERRKLSLWIALFDSSGDSPFADEHTDDPDAERQKQIALRQRAEQEVAKIPAPKPSPPITGQDILLAYGTNGNSRISPLEYEGAVPIYKDRGETFKNLPTQITNLIKRNSFEPNGYVYFTHLSNTDAVAIYQRDHKRSPTLGEIHRAIPTFWEQDRIRDGRTEKKMWDYWQAQYAQALTNYRRDLEAYEKGEFIAPLAPKHIEPKEPPKPVLESAAPKQIEPEKMDEKIRLLKQQLRERYTAEMKAAADIGDGDACRTINEALSSLERIGVTDGDGTATATVDDEDLRMGISAETGMKVLENGKTELMKKLEGYAREDLRPGGAGGSRDLVIVDGHYRRRRSVQSLSDAFAPDSLGSEEDEEEEESEEDDDDDYPGSSEDGRGLLTDVPLILGPSEIEVLPMLVMSAIVSVPTTASGESDQATQQTPELSHQNTHTLRTHLLLSQTSGRNLLRELLIFVAAWDLQDKELYFKFMIQIMEAILKNGLMPYAYHAFRDRSRSKDIISPAQAVIIKMLTCIFRGRNEGLKKAQAPADNSATSTETSVPLQMPSKVDLHILNFIFTEFRQHIIPQTCALIFLQGQIHQGKASPEDFPLNLWDMERMYEGVYQFLEFFAVLAEEQTGGRSAAGDVMVGKPIDSVAEEERFSWKKTLAEWEMASELVTLLRELEYGIPKTTETAPPIQQVPKRAAHPQAPPPPQRSLSADATWMPPPVSVEHPFDLDDSALPPLPTSTSSNPIFEAETPLAYPEEAGGGAQSMHDQDEPSDFEWRNLKKLTVLVLSSLTWKNRQVQDQVRKCGGLEALVGCCKPDEHNPYIREHAIMCLRFAVEGNEENAEVIRRMGMREHAGLAARAGKGKEVENGDAGGDGKVGLLMGAEEQQRQGSFSSLASSPSVPREVLDTNGYETFMDAKGQVGLRRKEGLLLAGDRAAGTASAPPAAQGLSSSASVGGAVAGGFATGNVIPGPSSTTLFGTTKMTAEKAAELMQVALRDLPLGDKLVSNRQKAEALAKLDRAFESTEKALGKQG